MTYQLSLFPGLVAPKRYGGWRSFSANDASTVRLWSEQWTRDLAESIWDGLIYGKS